MSYALGTGPNPRWGRIITKDGWSYQITDDDVLWAARAAQCEGSGEDGEKATLWTWTARFAMPQFRSRYRRLEDLIKAHSQPVNPIWTRTGDKCRPGGSFHGDTRFCSESQLARRELCATRPWDNVAPRTRATVEKWATARLPNPVPRAVDFAASTIGVQSGDREVARFRSGSSGPYNVFYSEERSRNLPTDYVQIQHEGRTAGPGVIGGFFATIRRYALPVGAALALAGAGVYFLEKRPVRRNRLSSRSRRRAS